MMNKYKILSLYVLYFFRLGFQKCFLFSIIMAIYNTGRYLEDSIGSLVNQTINFNKIQIILVNDGSTDETEEICLSYQKKYPTNVVYIKIEHSGVSKARNTGIKFAEGKYINFLDPDDKWDHRAFEYVLLFFKYYKNIDFIAGRLKFFEAKNDYHPLDYKYYTSRIVNLTKEYSCIHLSASSCFFRNSLIKNKQQFEEGVFSGEDARFVLNLLMSNPLMGLVKEAIYFYRRRADSSSTVQSQKKNVDFYFETIKTVSYYLINRSKALFSLIIPFIQFYIGYDILFRIQSPAFKFLDSDNFYNYCSLIEQLLRMIDDKYILEQKILSNKYKLLALSKKYQRDLRYDIKFQNRSFIYLDNIMINLETQKNIIIWRRLDIKNKILHLEGKDNFWMPRDTYSYSCKLGNKTFFPQYKEYSNYDFITMYGIIEKGRIIIFDIPLENISNTENIFFYITYMDLYIEIFPSLGWFSHIPPIQDGYYISEDYIIKYIDNRLVLFKYDEKLEFSSENLFCSQLKKTKKDYLIKVRKQCLNYRKMKKNHKKFEIWLINDRRNQAGDNGEYFFRYLKIKKPEGIRVYFTIQKNCSDFIRLQNLGHIIDLNSDKYLDAFLKSDKIISSISNPWVANPFNYEQKYIRDLLKFDFIFLQSGIIKDDLSKYLNKFNKGFSLFITSSMREYLSIMNYNYGYSHNDVVLTGLSRYDNLHKFKDVINKKKILLIIPTWRMSITGSFDLLTYESKYSDIFILTDFFKFYNNLINNQNLSFFMKQNNYKGILCLHPYFSSQWIDFKQNDIFSVMQQCDFQKSLLESSLLITDYSSIFFDFGYLKKPVIYAHFDYQDYRSNQYNKGYFDYNKDGFGPVCKDIQCLIDHIIDEIKTNCTLKKKYLRRINKFFQFSDENNSERIYRKIINTETIDSKSDKALFYSFLSLLIFIFLNKFIKKFLNSSKSQYITIG